jgi:hypothetical protein
MPNLIGNFVSNVGAPFWSYFFKNLPNIFPNSWFKTFSETLTNDQENAEGYCLVQRIEAVRLLWNGGLVKLTLRASSASNAYIDRVYISRPDPAGDPYDSGADLTPVWTIPFVIPANQAVTLPDLKLLPDNVVGLPYVYYNLDEGQPLLIAVDFSDAPPSGVRYTDALPPGEAVAYYQAGAHAAELDRTGPWNEIANSVYLIEKIEISSGIIQVRPGG